ncbi:MAG TPA: class I SAM-dependent methyltransferase [Thermoanaerobaculia bacterium]|nr:class I SAM-dependent methyltransferase [Thermoanaerobaculia bacterium]
MSAMAKLVMQKFYRKAEGRPEKLPWHRDEPEQILIDAVAARGGRGRALDAGCGAGVLSVWLAQQGMDVTGVDLFPEAIAMAQARAREHRVDVQLLAADVLQWQPERPFDFVLDSACLHALVGGSVAAYKRQLLRWLGEGGDYVLLHWGKRHPFDWRPIGPRRRSEAAIRKLFTPEFELLQTEISDFDAPLPFGPRIRGVGYWFRRSSSR